jgi:hypothetical protein
MVQNLKSVHYVFIEREPFIASAIPRFIPDVLVLTIEDEKRELNAEWHERCTQKFPDLEIVLIHRKEVGVSTTHIEKVIIDKSLNDSTRS